MSPAETQTVPGASAAVPRTGAKRRLKRLIRDYVTSHRRSFPVGVAERCCRSFLDWTGNKNYDARENGEWSVLRRLQGLTLTVLFDVGANVGDWTLAAAAIFPRAEIHAFEIAEATYRVLRLRTEGLASVHPVAFGLSDRDEEVILRYYENNPALSTVLPYPHELPFEVVGGRTIRGDAYARERGIDHIDFLKIDVEGMEPRVLEGMGELVERRDIDLIQFEYGQANILTRYLLRDYHEYFRERGYVVGKIYPDTVDFREYDMADEDFRGPNYLACRNDLDQHLERLKG